MQLAFVLLLSMHHATGVLVSVETIECWSLNNKVGFKNRVEGCENVDYGDRLRTLDLSLVKIRDSSRLDKVV